MSVVLSVEGLTVAAGGRTLFVGVSLQVAPGTLVGLTGRSGSGKTSLLRAIAGLSPPLAGTVKLGASLPDELSWPRFRRRVSYVPERPAFADATVLENLERPFAYAVAERPFDEPEALELLAQLGLDAKLGRQPARSLSAGEQRRVALARSLLLRPAFVLLDEPTAGLDVDAREAVAAVLRAFVAGGGGGLCVSHDEALLAAVCTSRLRTQDLTPDELLESAAVRDAEAP